MFTKLCVVLSDNTKCKYPVTSLPQKLETQHENPIDSPINLVGEKHKNVVEIDPSASNKRIEKEQVIIVLVYQLLLIMLSILTCLILRLSGKNLKLKKWLQLYQKLRITPYMSQGM